MGTVRRVGESLDRASPAVQRAFYATGVLVYALALVRYWFARHS